MPKEIKIKRICLVAWWSLVVLSFPIWIWFMLLGLIVLSVWADFLHEPLSDLYNFVMNYIKTGEHLQDKCLSRDECDELAERGEEEMKKYLDEKG